MSFAIMRIDKHKRTGGGSLKNASQHATRKQTTPNADIEKVEMNKYLIGQNPYDDVMSRLDKIKPQERKDSTICIEYFMGASKEWFDNAKKSDVDDWEKNSVKWLEDTYGKDNVCCVVVHYDETTPHISAFVTPIHNKKDVKRGKANRLSADNWIGTPDKLSQQQDTYANALYSLGLERGIKGSKANHVDIKDYYGDIHKQIDEIKIGIEDIPQKGMFENQDKYAHKVVEKVNEIINDSPLISKARAYDKQNKRADEMTSTAMEIKNKYETATREAEKTTKNNKTDVKLLKESLDEKVRDNSKLREEHKQEIERQRKDFEEKQKKQFEEQNRTLRGIPIRDVIEKLGGERDRQDNNKWVFRSNAYSVGNDELGTHKWNCWTDNSGGTGAINFVMHAFAVPFKEATRILDTNFGENYRAALAVEFANTIKNINQENKLEMPQKIDEATEAVKKYLIEERKFSEDYVGTIIDNGYVYGEKVSGDGWTAYNAIFCDGVNTDENVYAERVGIGKKRFKGLVSGSDTNANGFWVGSPPKKARTVILTESAIDAISLLELAQEFGIPKADELNVISTAGARGKIPEWIVSDCKEAKIICGYDRDEAGNKAAESLKLPRLTPPEGYKDWNELLVSIKTGDFEKRQEKLKSAQKTAKQQRDGGRGGR